MSSAVSARNNLKALISLSKMDNVELQFDIIPSQHDKKLGISRGVRVTHLKTKMSAQSTSEKSQFLNKVKALEKLKALLGKRA